MSYRDVIIGSARAQLDNANANSQAIAWFRSVENAEVAYGYRGYHIQDNDKWCAVFVSWCAAQAGILNQIVPFECGTNEMYNIYSSTGRGYTNPAEASHGDVVFVNSNGVKSNGINHVAFVVSVNNGYVYTVEGNNTLQGKDPNGVVETSWSLSNHVIAFGRNIVDYRYYRGHFDQFTNTLIAGWAWNGYNDDAVTVHVYIKKNGVTQIVVPLVANKYRGDLAAAGIGNGSHSFAYNTNLYQIYGAGSYTVEVYAITNCGNYNPMIENSPLNAYISQNNLNSLRYVKEDAGKFLILKDDVIIQEE